jgi:flagellar FliL protein
MAEAKEEAHAGEEKEEKLKSGNKSLILIIVVLVVALAGGIAAYLFLFSGSHKPAAEVKKEEPKEAKTSLVALDAFVLNLSERGRFLKVTMQFELTSAANQALVVEKTPQLRDAIITLVSSKSVEAVSSPEGKFQLKDELLLRANQAMGKDVFKNLYFTEFVMQ